jgi:hypothetical protein
MKLAQYEVLGWCSKKRPVPNGTIDVCLCSRSRMRGKEPTVSIVPDGTDLSFAPSPALRTGLLSSGPSLLRLAQSLCWWPGIRATADKPGLIFFSTPTELRDHDRVSCV